MTTVARVVALALLPAAGLAAFGPVGAALAALASAAVLAYTVRSLVRPGVAVAEARDEALGRLAVAEDQLEVLDATCRAALDENEHLRNRLETHAGYDHLTGMASRRGGLGQLQQLLYRAEMHHQRIALLFGDLDDFRHANAQLGHDGGDLVLRAVAARLRSAVGNLVDVAARLSGDEFILAAVVSDEEEALLLARRITEALSSPVLVGRERFDVKMTVGLAMGPNPGQDATGLLADADLALSEAKRANRGGIGRFDLAVRHRQDDTRRVEVELRDALGAGQLQLHFQPLFRAVTGRLVGAECLLRWRRRDGTWVSPADFIPVAERSDLIVDVSRYVLHAAAEQLARWKSVPGLADLHLAVNVSGRHLLAPTFEQDVLDPIRRCGIDPRSLTLEVTETAVVEELLLATERLAKLRAHGFRISIDDFGTGYTSIAHLRHFPADELKLDHSLVRALDQPDERSIAELVVNVAHHFNMEVVAEGVEDEHQRDMVEALGATYLQGFLLGRPVNPEAFELDYAVTVLDGA